MEQASKWALLEADCVEVSDKVELSDKLVEKNWLDDCIEVTLLDVVWIAVCVEVSLLDVT